MDIWTSTGAFMALQIANPVVVAKVQRLAKATGLSKTTIVEKAIDRLAAEHAQARGPGRLETLLAQLDRIPDRPDANDPLAWDDHGLPR
jgi:antitoxin VapB